MCRVTVQAITILHMLHNTAISPRLLSPPFSRVLQTSGYGYDSRGLHGPSLRHPKSSSILRIFVARNYRFRIIGINNFQW
jgi:hypothetical protein